MVIICITSMFTYVKDKSYNMTQRFNYILNATLKRLRYLQSEQSWCMNYFPIWHKIIFGTIKPLKYMYWNTWSCWINHTAIQYSNSRKNGLSNLQRNVVLPLLTKLNIWTPLPPRLHIVSFIPSFPRPRSSRLLRGWVKKNERSLSVKTRCLSRCFGHSWPLPG